jgi:hypothetical protein
VYRDGPAPEAFYLIDYLSGFAGVAPVVDGDSGPLFSEGECYGTTSKSLEVSGRANMSIIQSAITCARLML